MAVLWVIRASASALPDLPTVGLTVAEFQRRTSYFLAAVQGGALDWVGKVAQTATETAPKGWLLCDGSEVRRSDFPALWAALGTRFGAGDGVSTFNLPTQTQAAATPADVPPAQTVTGGSVDPAAPVVVPPTTDNPTGGSGAGSVVGGRPPKLGSNELPQ